MSIKQAILSMPGAIRLTDCTVIPQSRFKEFGICFKRVANYDGDTFRVTITNNGAAPLKIKEVVLFHGDLGVSPDTEFYADGFRMLAQYNGTLNNPQVIGSYGTDVDFFKFEKNVFNEDKWTCNNVFNLLPKGQPYFLAGFTSCNKYQSVFRFKDSYLECSMDTEGLTLLPRRSWEMEEFALMESCDNDELFAKLGDYVRDNHPRMKWHEIPLGWCSYHSCRGVHIDIMAEQAAAMAKRIPELQRVQVDAGYSGAPFRDVRNTSGSGGAGGHGITNYLPDVCNKIRETGMEAAGYWSPFIYNVGTALPEAHPDWFVQDENGNPIVYRNRNILDGTNPEARRFQRSYLNWMYNACGLRYFKLDFTEYGTLPGVRFDPTKTGVEAYRMAMEEMTRDVRGDSFILNCNAPFWPGLGLSHGNRTSNDIHRRWPIFKMNALEQFSRNWQHSTLWINDPDGVELTRIGKVRLNENGEKEYAETATLTDAEFEFHKAFVIACGGMVMGGDLLDEMTDEQIEVMKKMITVRGEAAKFDYSADGGREFNIGRKNIEGGKLICVFNWSDDDKTYTVNVSGKNEKPAGYTITDFWSDKKIGDFADTFTVDVPAHGGRVFKLV